jgi:protein-L-isoaspartate(D-aspartate) O-methyltransferase
MNQTVDVSEDSAQAAVAREAMVDHLLTDGMITSPLVEAAFRSVHRHRFVPDGTPLAVAYNPAESVATKRDEHGRIISSVSAPFIQAQMIEQGELQQGMTVLEIGSGGYNAALLAEVVGPDGRVVSVDIDADVTDRASALLNANGYRGRVTVVQADAEHGLPELGAFDAVIVTVGAWDIAPAWIRHLTPGGRLVVPLRMNGVTRSIGFRRESDHLVSTSARVCGFVPMQGAGEHHDRAFLLPDAHGRHVRLQFDTGAPQDQHLLDGVLATDRTTVWSGVTIAPQVSFADLHLWLACFLPGFCRLAVDDGIELPGDGVTWFPFATVQRGSFAYLTLRHLPGNAGAEFGAGAYGRHGEQAAAALVEQIQVWARQARPGPEPTFAFWPTGTGPGAVPAHVAVLPKRHGVVTVSWPAAS